MLVQVEEVLEKRMVFRDDSGEPIGTKFFGMPWRHREHAFVYLYMHLYKYCTLQVLVVIYSVLCSAQKSKK